MPPSWCERGGWDDRSLLRRKRAPRKGGCVPVRGQAGEEQKAVEERGWGRRGEVPGGLRGPARRAGAEAALGPALAPRSRAWRAAPVSRARAARGCPWRGDMWDGAEPGPAASVCSPRQGGTHCAACRESAVGCWPWGGRQGPGTVRSLQAGPSRSPRGKAVVLGQGDRVTFGSRRSSSAGQPSSLLALLGRPWQSSGSLFSLFRLENNSEIPEKG